MNSKANFTCLTNTCIIKSFLHTIVIIYNQHPRHTEMYDGDVYVGCTQLQKSNLLDIVFGILTSQETR